MHEYFPEEFTDYYNFFGFLTEDCEKEDYTHIGWCCTPDKRTLCNHILDKWDKFVQALSQYMVISNATVVFEIFKSTFVKDKKTVRRKD